MTDTKQQAKWIRIFRWLHRKIAIPTLVFMFIIALTGVLLGVKKQTGLQAPTMTGASKELKSWLPIDSLAQIAKQILADSINNTLPSALDRIDIRPEKGIAKFVYTDHYWSIQLDGTTGILLSIERRNSDLIENIHDGSIVDRIFKTGEKAKIFYTVVSGLCLMLLVMSGFWLWYGPKRLRSLKRKVNHPL